MKQNHLFSDLLAKSGIRPENPVEQSLLSHPEFQEGCMHGRPRRGHPEGQVIWHIAEVLKNVDRWGPPHLRKALRWITLVHDTFKFREDHRKPRVGENHHARMARLFAKNFISDPLILLVIEAHDDAYFIWKKASQNGNWKSAHQSAKELVKTLGKGLELYLAFYRCDNATGDKTPDDYLWFSKLCKENGWI